MDDMLIDSVKFAACNTAEADAIRAKTGGTDPIPYDYANNKGFADAISEIPSGETIEHGVKAVLGGDGYAKEIEVIGDTIYYGCCKASSSMTKVTAPDAITLYGDALRDLTNANMSPLTLPKVEHMAGGANGIYNCYFPQIYLPLLNTNPANASSRQIYDTKLTYIEIGSIGHPVIADFNTIFFRGNSQAFDCVIYTEKTTLAEAQALFPRAPWNGTNATIIYKNSVTGEVLI